MADIEDLKSSVTDALESKGILNKLRASLRAEIYHSIQGGQPPQHENSDGTHDHQIAADGRQICHENILIGELIREFLVYNECVHSAAVVTDELGLGQLEASSTEHRRRLLMSELGLHRGDTGQGFGRPLPLLYALLAHFITRDQQPRQP